jgi:hypothetical protein
MMYEVKFGLIGFVVGTVAISATTFASNIGAKPSPIVAQAQAPAEHPPAADAQACCRCGESRRHQDTGCRHADERLAARLYRQARPPAARARRLTTGAESRAAIPFVKSRC